jgi:hypothetical protein
VKNQLQALIDSLNRGARPDLYEVSKWLAKQDVSVEEWEDLSREMCRAYNLSGEEELTTHLKRPTIETLTEYVDDFSTMMDEVEISGWLRDYVEHTRGMEAPTPYHFGTALTILGATLRRQVHVDQGYFQLWPAVQTMLVGPSGKVKKSTSASYGVELAMDASSKSGAINFLPDEGSAEALKTELAQLSKKKGEATGLLYVSELGTFLGKQDYNVNLVQALTDLFDSRLKKRRRTHSQGIQKMDNIAVSFLGCSNEDWLADAIPASAFGGGFFGRMLVFHQPDTDRCFSRPSVGRSDERGALKDFLIKAVTISKCEAVPTRPADKWFDTRYKEIKEGWPDDERLVPFWERIPDHILRIGMLLSISDAIPETPTVVITDRHLIQADAIIRWILRYLPKVYVNLGGTAFGHDHHRIYNAIKRKGGVMEERELGRKMARRMSLKRMEEHLNDMVKSGLAKRVKMNAWEGKYGWAIIPGKEF